MYCVLLCFAAPPTCGRETLRLPVPCACCSPMSSIRFVVCFFPFMFSESSSSRSLKDPLNPTYQLPEIIKLSATGIPKGWGWERNCDTGKVRKFIDHPARDERS
uniref:Putative secreted protein n=1 Tax=Anopheles darlingi TaxID=43151 RepID=A0A2M4D6T4_ANODA